MASMRTNSSVCPYCGQPLLHEPRVTGRERRRLVEILARRPHGMTRRELADWLYADDPNGGPENTFAVCQLVHQARLQLAAQGYTITWRRRFLSPARPFLARRRHLQTTVRYLVCCPAAAPRTPPG